MLKGIAAHYVMRTDDRVALMERQRDLIADLVTALTDRGPDDLERPFADDWHAAADDAGQAAGRDRPGRLAHRRQRRRVAPTTLLSEVTYSHPASSRWQRTRGRA